MVCQCVCSNRASSSTGARLTVHTSCLLVQNCPTMVPLFLYVHFIQKYTWLVLTLHIWISNNFRLQKNCILYVSLTTIGFFRCYIYSHWHSQNNNLSFIMNMGHRLRVCLCFCCVFFFYENHNNKIIVYKPKHVCFSTLPKLLWE